MHQELRCVMRGGTEPVVGAAAVSLLSDLVLDLEKQAGVDELLQNAAPSGRLSRGM